MDLERAALRNFRNFGQLDVEFGRRFTILHGHNGAGKTNLLEALYLVSTLRSFRSSELGPLVRHGESLASVELHGRDRELDLPSELTVRLERGAASTRRTAYADGKAVRSGPAFYGRIRAVLFTPEDLAVLRGGPAARRQFLDRVLFARDRAHIADIQTYEKLLRSRNHVLKREEGGRSRTDLLDTYEVGLADCGARIWNRREGLLETIAGSFEDAFARIHGHLGPSPRNDAASPTQVGLRYQAKLEGTHAPHDRVAALRTALLARRPEDLRRKTTTVGPHRDDMSVVFDGNNAGQFASQGQSRALVLAFKVAELKLAASESPRPPLLLLDDVSSELDPRRSAMLFEVLCTDVGQCVLTTTDARYVTLPSTADACWWRVAEGRLDAAASPHSGAS